MDLYFSSAAQVELDEAFAYMEGEEPGLGYRFTADVDVSPAAGLLARQVGCEVNPGLTQVIGHKDSAAAPSLAPLSAMQAI